jgi:hypothetical protein
MFIQYFMSIHDFKNIWNFLFMSLLLRLILQADSIA